MAAMALSIVSNAKVVRMGGWRSFGARRGGEERSTASDVGRSGITEGYGNETGMVSCKWTATGVMTGSKRGGNERMYDRAYGVKSYARE